MDVLPAGEAGPASIVTWISAQKDLSADVRSHKQGRQKGIFTNPAKEARPAAL